MRRWVNWRTVHLWSTMTSNLWTTWKCVHATQLYSAAQKTMALALKSWTHFSWSWKHSCPLQVDVSGRWKNRDRWAVFFYLSSSHSLPKVIYVYSLKQILTDWQDKKGDKRFLKLGKDPDLAASSRHSKPKKQKLDGKGSHGPGPGPGRPKTKNMQTKVPDFEFEVEPQDIPRNPKNDAPNRFVG